MDIEHLSGKIKEHGYAPLVTFLIESHVPAFTVLHSIFLCSKPFMVPFVSSSALQAMNEFFSDESVRDQLLLYLQEEQV